MLYGVSLSYEGMALLRVRVFVTVTCKECLCDSLCLMIRSVYVLRSVPKTLISAVSLCDM